MFRARDKTLTIPMAAPDTLCDDVDDESEFPQKGCPTQEYTECEFP